MRCAEAPICLRPTGEGRQQAHGTRPGPAGRVPLTVGSRASGPRGVARMDLDPSPDLALLEARAAEAARLLRLLANEKRLLVLCHIVSAGEMKVGELADAVGLSQSALSQHLAKLREDRLVATRREAQTVYYRLADPRAARLLDLLRTLYCPPEG